MRAAAEDVEEHLGLAVGVEIGDVQDRERQPSGESSTSTHERQASATETSVTTTPAREIASRGLSTANSPALQLNVAVTLPALFVTEPAGRSARAAVALTSDITRRSPRSQARAERS